MRKITVGPNESGQRLNRFLLKYLSAADNSFIYKMLRKKNITLNDKKADGSEHVATGDVVTLWLAEETIEKFTGGKTFTPVKFNIDVVYEDKHILIMNKAANVLSQKAQDSDVSINEEMISYLLAKGEVTLDELKTFRPSICNRLDRNTTGLIIAGKDTMGLQEMGELISERGVDKYYQCIVKGVIKEPGTLKGYLLKKENHNTAEVSLEQVPGSAYIETYYEPVADNGQYTHIKVKLITGRSHQIRAHMASIGHPLIGDGKYGDKHVNNYFKDKFHLKHQLLHSYKMVFPEAEGCLVNLSKKTIIAPLPALFKRILNVEGINKGDK